MKKIAVCILAAVFSFSLAEYHFVNAKTLNQLIKEQKELKQKKIDAEQALKDVKNKQATVSQELDALDQQVNTAVAELYQAEDNLSAMNQKLEESERRLEEATVAKEKQLKAFSKRIRFIYEQGSVGYFEIVLNAENFNDFFTRMQYVSDIMDFDKKLLDNLKENESTINTETIQIQKEKEEVEVLTNAQREKTNQLMQVQEKKKEIILSYEKDEKKYEQYLQQLEQGSQEVEKLIRQSEAAAATSAAGTKVVYSGGQFLWPVPGRYKISSGYVGRLRPIGKGSEFHTGFDIPAPTGTNILAGGDGVVITAGWVNGYGNTVIINHGSGISTLYGHNSKLLVSKGQKVTRGQTIAKCGSTGNSTGPHCHFEVRVNGKHTNPAPYLGM